MTASSATTAVSRTARRRRRVAVLGAAAVGALSLASSARVATAESLAGADGDIDCTAIAESTDAPPEFSTFLDMVKEATGGLDGPGTLLVPIDPAFSAIPENVLSMIVDDPELLVALVGYHYIDGQLLSAADLVAAGSVASSMGAELHFSEDDGVITVNDDAVVLCADIANGGLVLQVIDGVLQPPTTATGAPGSSVPGDSVPGNSVPGNSVPTNSVPGSSVPGFDADGQEIATAWQTVTDSTSEIDDVIALIEDGESAREAAENYPAAADAVRGITSEVRSVAIDGNVADITFVLFFDGVEAPYGELPAELVFVDGSWLVPLDQYCSFQSMARNSAPCGNLVGRG